MGWQEQKRLEALIAEGKELTFRPRIKSVPGVSSRLALQREPGAFLIKLEDKMRRLKDMAERAQQEREEQETAECSFKPRIRRLPPFIKHMATARRLLSPREFDPTDTQNLH
eukprot:jgi/Botrbrau1/5443/Bobra.182_1s0045.1